MPKQGSWKKPLLIAELLAALIGAVIGFMSRLMLVGTAPSTEILPSWFGLIAFCVIGYGLYGLLFGIQHRILLILPRTTALMAGIMWVIPFPN